jgi:hypothetical protein
LIEIAGSAVFADRISYPTEADWDAFYERECQSVVEARVFRGLIDPRGRFYVRGIGPTVEGWAAGDRQVWCGASAREGTAPPPDVDGAYVLFTGKVAGQSQTLVDPPGTCRAAEADWPVPCDQVHSWEVTGTADVTGKVNGPPAPGDSKGWDRLVGADCKRLGTAYLGHPPTGDVNSGWIAIEPGGWAAGRRLVECVVARYQNDAAVPMTGSLRG